MENIMGKPEDLVKRAMENTQPTDGSTKKSRVTQYVYNSIYSSATCSLKIIGRI